jgi:hypothetical protein
MLRKLLFLALVLLSVRSAYAQDEVSGRVYENKTNVFLQGVKVENLKTHLMTLTHTDGSFTLKAKKGDLLTFVNANYRPDTVFLTDLRYIQVFLEPNRQMLNEVTVTGQELKGNTGFNATPQKRVLGAGAVTYQTDSTGNYKGGVVISLPTGDSKRKEDERIARDVKRNDIIAKAFSADSLRKYVPLTGQEMQNFIVLYTPDTKTFFGPDFHLTTYVNECYKEFLKIPVEQRRSKELTQLKNEN